MAEILQQFDSRIDNVGIDDRKAAVYYRKPAALAAGDAITVDARGMRRVAVLSVATTVVTWSRVDTHDAASHGTGARVVAHAGGDLLVSLPVDWPFYRISVATAGGVVAVV